MKVVQSKQEKDVELRWLRQVIRGSRERLKSAPQLSERAETALLAQISRWEARLSKLESTR